MRTAKNLFLLSFFLMTTYSKSWSQSNNISYQKFRENLFSEYKRIGANPSLNFFEILNQTNRASFQSNNPYYLAALGEIKQAKRLAEQVALDTLFYRVTRDLRIGPLWSIVSEPSLRDSLIFALYSKELCSCVQSKRTDTRGPSNFFETHQNCEVSLTTKESFMNEIRALTGGVPPANMKYFQKQLIMYVYQNCMEYNRQFDKSILEGNIKEEYYDIKVSLKIIEAEEVIRFYERGEGDSLARLFPGHAKYMRDFLKIKDMLAKGSSYKIMTYASNGKGNRPGVIIEFLKGREKTGEAIFFTDKFEIASKFSGVYFSNKPTKSDGIKDPEEVIEQK